MNLFTGAASLEICDCSRIDELYCQLNDEGKEKAIEQVELLTKIPEYRYDTEENTEN